MDLYRNHVNAESVLALCCTMATETYHHWRVFTAGIEGVCIEFELEPLAKTVAAIENVKSGPVNYRKIDELKAMSTSDLESLPFIKRLGYKDEKEWRIVAKSNHGTKEFIDIPIELSWINRIILNPWMPPPLVTNIRGIIKSLPDCSKLSVVTTGLTNSRLWKEAGKAITAPKN